MTRNSRRADSPLTTISTGEAEALAKQILARTTTPRAELRLYNLVTLQTKFTRNDVKTMEKEDVFGIVLTVNFDGKVADGGVDPEAIDDSVRAIEEAAKAGQKDFLERLEPPAGPVTFADPPIYFETSVRTGTAEAQGELIRQVAEQVDRAGLIGAGAVEMNAEFWLRMNSAGLLGHTRNTYGEYTVTARTTDGKGSGWAWGGTEDFSRVDPAALTAKAIDLSQRSGKPVAVEPGRYTVILEPEAVAQLVKPITGDETRNMDMANADEGATVYSKVGGGNKIGLKMTDERIQIVSDPMDPDVPFSPFVFGAPPVGRTSWFEHGILQNLSVQSWYAKKVNRPPLEGPWHAKLAVPTGSTQSLEEMIASTKRGIWVHQFAAARVINPRTLMLTGVTRNGTFLIENGKITKPIKNLRFNESPFFFLNKLDAWSPPVRAHKSWAVPRLKVHDFEFTSLSDAI